MQTWPGYTPELGPCQYGRTLLEEGGAQAPACPQAGEKLLVVLDETDPAAMPMNIALCQEHMDHVQPDTGQADTGQADTGG